MQAIDLTVDVTAAANIGEAAHVAVTITLPDPASIPSPEVAIHEEHSRSPGSRAGEPRPPGMQREDGSSSRSTSSSARA